jgi:DNA adenine methylase
VKGLIPWVGGKHLLASRIVGCLEQVEHRKYVEVFGGGFHVLLNREPAPVEVLNDLNKDLVTLYRVVAHHPDEMVRCFRWALYSRDEFDRLMQVPPETLTDVQRAARFFYLQRTSYGGKAVRRSFAMRHSGRPRLNLMRLEEDLSAIHLRLATVVIENLPWRRCVEAYDQDDAMLYLDPPYYGHEGDYGEGLFARSEFAEMADVLAGLKGHFLLSLNDTPEVRALFGRFHLHPVTTTYSLAAKSNDKKVRELLISDVRLRV